MSFILDALRKSDARRRLNEDDSSEPGSSSVRKRRRRRLVVPLAVLIGVLLVGGAGALLFSQEPVQQRLAGLFGGEDPVPPPVEPSEPSEVEVTEVSPGEPWDVREEGVDERTDERADAAAESAVAREDSERDWRDRDRVRERVVEDPDEIEAELQRRVAETEALVEDDPDEAAEPVVDRRDPTAVRSSRQIVGEAPRRDRPEREREDEEVARLRESARQIELDRAAAARRPREEPDATGDTDTGEDTGPWRPGAAEYVRAWELPLSVRRNLPDLKLNIHVYSAEHENRFVLVNGERFVTGDQITDGVQLVDIRREGAVVDYRDYRFLLEP